MRLSRDNPLLPKWYLGVFSRSKPCGVTPWFRVAILFLTLYRDAREDSCIEAIATHLQFKPR